VFALEGLRVIEWADLVAGPYCGRVLADAGADVIKVETPDIGDISRSRGPFYRDEPDREGSALFIYLNTNKSSITLNPATPTGGRLLRELILQADVFIEDKPPSTLLELDLDFKSLHGNNERLIQLSITPFGCSGPYRDFRMHPGNLAHAGGQAWLQWQQVGWERPIAAGGMIAAYDAGLVAATALLAALFYRGTSGRGQHVDISQQEAAMAMDRVVLGRVASDGIDAIKFMPQSIKNTLGLFQCRDGYAIINAIEEWQWQGLVDAMGDPQWAKDAKFTSRADRADNTEEMNRRIQEWAVQFPMEEVYHLCQTHSVPAGAVRRAAEILGSTQMRGRGFFIEQDHPHVGRISVPTTPYQLSPKADILRRHAPLLGQDNEEIYENLLGLSRREQAELAQSRVI
jgi:CoA:oxalate CoA-transferase